MLLSVPTNPNGIPEAITIAASQAQGVESAVATAAASIAGQAQSAVSSAITAVESAIGSHIPKNCSLSITHFCVGFTDHIDYQELPLRLLNIIPSSVLAIRQPSLANLDRALAVVGPRSITSGLVIVLCFAALSIGLDILCICFLLLDQLGIMPFNRMLRIAALVRGLCSAICCIPLISFTIILHGILSKSTDLPKEISVEAGEASRQVLVALTCAIFIGIFTLARWLLSRYDEDVL